MPKRRSYSRKRKFAPRRRKSTYRRRRSKVLVPLNYARQRLVTAGEIQTVENQNHLKIIIPWQ